METKLDKCLNPNCNRHVASRGLCITCYQSAASLVARKKTTWEALEADGKIKPKISRRSHIKNWLLGVDHGRNQIEPNVASAEEKLAIERDEV